MGIIAFLLGSLTTAHAVPVKLTQQGRLLDSTGAGMTGNHLMAFRFFETQMGGSSVWEEILTVNFTGGYYTVILGADSANPLEDNVLANHPLYLEVEVDSNGPIGIRQPIISTPYSRLSGTAVNLNGGVVDASQISVAGNLVIDGNGNWVGPTATVEWAAVQNVPADLADGDDDTLAGITCNTGEILGWNGSQWACTADNGLTEAEVEAFVVNDPIDLHAGSTVGGLPILTQGDGDTLSGLSCQSGEIAKWDAGLGQWLCDIDGQLSETDVLGYVTGTAIDLATGSTLGGETVLTSSGCAHAEVLTYDANSGEWVCDSIGGLLDVDNDGVMQWNDCDDNDPLVLGQNLDADCDGTFTADDCDDTDPSSTIVANDFDCDGVLTADDCGDANPNLGAQALDMDCDGVLATVDCNDFDPAYGSVLLDGDCDLVLTSDDCNDNDPTSNTVAEDGDCDGLLTADDCDDSDSNSTAIADDADCDGTLTALDCDDLDPLSTTRANDFDCDEALTVDDCNDNDPNVSPYATEVCQDGIDNDCDGVDAPCWTSGQFTTCNNSGQNGPGQSDCDSVYSGTELAGAVTLINGIQNWTVPATGTYTIQAYGAKGQDIEGSGGDGAYVYGDFSLTVGETLQILVGQIGDNCYGGGGGGGTFVVDSNSNPLIIAGGGGSSGWGGGYSGQNSNYSHGVVSSTGQSGHSGYEPGGSGGSGGNGGYTYYINSWQAYGGGGFSGNGEATGTGGYAFLNGGAGGTGYNGCIGGFGGGGGAGQWGGAGGGGYSGGGATSRHANGGGGGSYNTGSNTGGTDGANDGAGYVIITLN